MKKHIHKFEHIIRKGKNMNGVLCLWLFHKCKCGVKADGILIENLTKHNKNFKKDCKHINTPVKLDVKNNRVICLECGKDIGNPS